MPTVWTEVVGEGLSVTWVWHHESLLQVPIAHEGYHLEPPELEALSRYAQNKEFDLLMEQRFDRADFDGTLEEYVREMANVS